MQEIRTEKAVVRIVSGKLTEEQRRRVIEQAARLMMKGMVEHGRKEHHPIQGVSAQ